ncbi:MAG: LytR/AlgR family response regulator transcription factor [Chitinophagales bacterium]
MSILFIPMKKIEFNTPDGFYSINPDDILYIEASNRYAKLILVDGSEIDLALNLQECIGLLPKMNFYSINRSVIININRIFKFIHTEDRRGKVTMRNGEIFEVSRRRKSSLVFLIKKMTNKY